MGIGQRGKVVLLASQISLHLRNQASVGKRIEAPGSFGAGGPRQSAGWLACGLESGNIQPETEVEQAEYANAWQRGKIGKYLLPI